jgi:hypothetical protein
MAQRGSVARRHWRGFCNRRKRAEICRGRQTGCPGRARCRRMWLVEHHHARADPRQVAGRPGVHGPDGASAGWERQPVSAGRECSWSATASASWIQLTGASGQGDGSVGFAVPPNPDAAPRSGTVCQRRFVRCPAGARALPVHARRHDRRRWRLRRGPVRRARHAALVPLGSRGRGRVGSDHLCGERHRKRFHCVRCFAERGVPESGRCAPGRQSPDRDRPAAGRSTRASSAADA